MSTRMRFVPVCALLPLIASLVWPRSYGPSLHVTPFLIGLTAIAWAGLWLRPTAPIRAVGWLLLTLLVVWASPWTQTLQLWATLGAAVAAWIAMGIGREVVLRESVAKALLGALITGMVINVAVAWLQFFDAEMSLYPLVSVNGSLRPYGNLRQPNHLATLCVVGLASVWFGAQKGFWRRRLTVLLAMVALSGLALSDSRAGWVELVLVSLFMAWWSDGDRRFNRLLFGLAPLWTLAWVFAAQGLAQLLEVQLSAMSDRGIASVSARLAHWQAAWDLAVRHPTSGVGWGEFRFTRFMEQPIVTGAEVADNAHNLVLHMLAELGFASTFLILAPVTWVLLIRQPWQRNRSAGERWGWLLIVAIGTHSMLEYPLWYLNFLLPMAMAFGAIMATSGEKTPAGERAPWARLSLVVSLGLFLMTAAATYDFSRVTPAFYEDNRATGDPVTSAEAQRTWFFGVYADRILAEHIQVTQDNAQEMWLVSLRSMHAAHAPLNLWSGLAAQCQLGGGVYASELAKRFELAFPEAFEEFKSLTPAPLLKACIHVDH